jgi:hypothetical protein
MLCIVCNLLWHSASPIYSVALHFLRLLFTQVLLQSMHILLTEATSLDWKISVFGKSQCLLWLADEK